MRKLYLRIAGMLVLSTAAVLMCMAGAYWALAVQWRQYSANLLAGERPEVEMLLERSLGTRNTRPVDLLDDSGQHLSFAVFDEGRLILQSDPAQVPATVLVHTLTGPSVEEFTFSGRPFLLYHYTWQFAHRPYEIAIYQMNVREREMLDRAREVLFVTGLAGAFVAVLLNLRLARAALEPLRRTWEMQREWLLELSHELQTPLAVARAGILAADTDPARGVAVQAIEDASSLVRDIVYLSKLSTLPDPSNIEPVPVSEVTEEAVQKLSPLAAHRKIEIAGSAEPGLFVATTPERWSRLVSLVVKNGIDHGVEETRLCWRLRRDGSKVVFVVRNRTSSSAFRPNAQAGSPVKRGVGLLIVERLVQEMDGTFTIGQHEGEMMACVKVPALRSRRV